MTRNEMIQFIKANPHVPVTHILFAPDEYIYSNEDGIVFDESGYLFEDWKHDMWSAHNGIRLRCNGLWEDNWAVRKLTTG